MTLLDDIKKKYIGRKAVTKEGTLALIVDIDVSKLPKLPIAIVEGNNENELEANVKNYYMQENPIFDLDFNWCSWSFLSLLDDKDPIEADTVYKPQHYVGEFGLEVEEVLENFIPRYQNAYVGHRVASAVEYLLRAPYKNGDEDIRKAGKNIEQIIEYMEEFE